MGEGKKILGFEGVFVFVFVGVGVFVFEGVLEGVLDVFLSEFVLEPLRLGSGEGAGEERRTLAFGERKDLWWEKEFLVAKGLRVGVE